MGPGDVLYVESSSRMWLNVGHVLVLLSEPRLIHFDSEEADDIREVCNIWPVLCARSMEATRGDSGLHQSDVFFHLTDGGRFNMIAELDDEGEWVPYEDNTTELWTAPVELRAGFRVNLMAEVVKEMTAVEDDWSLSTAIRAVLRHADVSDRLDTGVVLQELQDCWLKKPICTSIVIAFWQRYLFKLAELPSAPADPAALIFQWMPLKADRTLPNELLSTMARRGWRKFQQEPVSQMR